MEGPGVDEIKVIK